MFFEAYDLWAYLLFIFRFSLVFSCQKSASEFISIYGSWFDHQGLGALLLGPIQNETLVLSSAK